MNVKGVFSHNTDEWETPKELFETLNAEFGFTLDPCSTEKNHKCEKYYTIENCGLSHTWIGETVFVNPPYSRCTEWVQKSYYEWLTNNITIVLLIPARTDTKWFHNYVYGKAEIRFIKGRLKFSDSKNSAPFPSMLVIYRKEETK